MSPSGIFTICATTITLVFILIMGYIFHKFKWKWRWWYSSIFAIGCLIYFIAGRWVSDFHELQGIGHLTTQQVSEQFKPSYLISKVFLLDMCPYLLVVISFFAIFPFLNRIAYILAPVGLWTSCATLYLAVSTYNSPLTWQFIFLGYSPNLLFFMMHYLLMCLSLILLLSVPRYKWHWIILATLFILLYIAYVFVVKFITGANWNLTGLTKNDWIITYHNVLTPSEIIHHKDVGEYYALGKAVGISWPAAPVFLFVGSGIMVVIIILLAKFTRYLFLVGKISAVFTNLIFFFRPKKDKPTKDHQREKQKV